MNEFQRVNFFPDDSKPTVCIDVNQGSTSKRFMTQMSEDNKIVIMLWNAGDSEVFIKIGGESVVASIDCCYPIPPGMKEPILVADRGEFIAAVCPQGKESKLYITP